MRNGATGAGQCGPGPWVAMPRPFGGSVAALAFGLLAAPLWAETFDSGFHLPPGYEDRAVSWSATPLDLPRDADMLAAMTMEPESRPGPWTVALVPGDYQISAFSEVELFELILTLPPTSGQSYEVPLLKFETAIPYQCTEAPVCTYADAETGLAFALPQGWAAERPYHFDLGDGERAEEISAVFFQNIEGEGADVWFLNPSEWVEDENGPCETVTLGAFCTFERTPGALAAREVILGALQLTPPG